MLVCLFGPHAIGKSTALARWSKRYPSLRTFPIDDMRREFPDEKAKSALAARCVADQSVVYVIDSARTFDCGFLAEILVVTCRPEVLRRNMVARCERRGKKFREESWGERVLVYESKARYANFLERTGYPGTVLTINDYSDWQTVDEYFYALYRRLCNRRDKCQ